MVGSEVFQVDDSQPQEIHSMDLDSLLFEIDYPEIDEGVQPRHRFMSAFEQRVRTAPREAHRTPSRPTPLRVGSVPPPR